VTCLPAKCCFAL